MCFVVDALARLFAAGRRGDNNACFAEQELLQSNGVGAIDIVLDELDRMRISGEMTGADDFALSCALYSLKPSVQPKHARRIAEALLWDEVALVPDGSKRYRLLGMLKLFGGADEVPLLEQLRVKVLGMVYPDTQAIHVVHAQAIEQYYIQEAIAAIQKRTDQQVSS